MYNFSRRVCNFAIPKCYVQGGSIFAIPMDYMQGGSTFAICYTYRLYTRRQYLCYTYTWAICTEEVPLLYLVPKEALRKLGLKMRLS
jgi:hypothetical protein